MGLTELVMGFRKGRTTNTTKPVIPKIPKNPPQAGELKGEFYTRTGQCNQCGKCCTNIYLVYNQHTVQTIEEFQRLRQFEPEYGYFTPLDETEHGMRFRCKHLQANNACSIYGDRPDFCRQYPSEHAIVLGAELAEGCGYAFKPNQPFAELLAETALVPPSKTFVGPED